MIIEGLESSGTDRGKSLALELARTWVGTNYVAFQETGYVTRAVDAGSRELNYCKTFNFVVLSMSLRLLQRIRTARVSPGET